ncbi:MAG TPA: hypothetical protein VJ696_00375 [Rhodanobacteraceae bacterium]|nr:hypothetical protein [Rhodanobacteraceae bacterium]
MTNSHDGVLDESLDCDDENHVARQPRLGMLSSKEKGAERASGILYLEAEVGDSHRTFTRGGANQNEAFCGAMASLLRGKLPSFDSAMHVDHQANLLLMRRSNHVARCTAGEPEDRDDD